MVVGNGRILSNATVIVRDGLIEAVGTDVAVPPLAWKIDLSGMYVYPGLIDALSEVALKKGPSRSASPQRTQVPPASQQQPENPEGAGLFPHLRAADRLESDMKKLSSWRDSGVLTLNVAPDRGIFMGQTAVVNLNGEEPDRMIVRSPVAMRMSFQSVRPRTYPSSLMGVIAHIKQTLLDARHYGTAREIYESHPRNLKRPETDRALEALQPVIQSSMPLIFPAKEAKEVRRVLNIIEGFPLRCIVAGGFQADQLAEELKDRDIPVLLSLNFPEKEKDTHPAAEESLRVIRYRHQAPQSAFRLHQAGVRFAFYSDGLKSGSDYLKNLRRTVQEGLPKEAALQAATLGAAQILGVDQQLGSIESGKIANLVVSDGDLFDEKAKIKHVFVDGEKHDVPAKTRDKKEEGESADTQTGLRQMQSTAPDTTPYVQLDFWEGRRAAP